MPRNFGVRRNHFGEELFRDFWHANDNEREVRWVYAVIGVPVVAIVLVAIFVG